jgi:hypothetical protein
MLAIALALTYFLIGGLTPTRIWASNAIPSLASPTAAAMGTDTYNLPIFCRAVPIAFVSAVSNPETTIPASNPPSGIIAAVRSLTKIPLSRTASIICDANTAASASSVYVTTDTLFPANGFSSSPIDFCCSNVRKRGEISFSRARFAARNSSNFLLDSVSSSLWRLTTNQVANPAISPNPPTASSDPRIISSQVWSVKPQIIRSLFDNIVGGIILLCASGLLAFAALFFKRAWDSYRC